MPRKKKSAVSAAAEEPAERQRVGLMSDVAAAHGAYGAKHDEYKRYREYCARRLRRIRHAAKAPCGTRTRFRATDNPTPDQARRDPRTVLLLLVEAERAWACWMELKAPLAREAASDVHFRPHYHLLRRIDKAAAWAAQLETLCAEACDARTQAEAAAYAAWMKGNAAMEHRSWPEAHAAFATANALCERLSISLQHSGDAAVLAVLRDRIEETEPKLRFCQHNMRLLAAAAAPSTTAVLTEAQGALLETVAREAEAERSAQRRIEIVWRGVAVPVRIARVRQLLAATSGDLNEALQLLHAAAAKPKPDPAVKQLLEYVSWRRHEYTIAHSVAEALKQQHRAEERIRLYDAAISAVGSAAALMPGAPGEEQTEYAKQYAAKGLLLRAQRCIVVAEIYERQKKWSETEALLSQTLRLAEDVQVHVADCANPSAEIVATLDALKKQARMQRCIVIARAAAPPSAVSDETEKAATVAVADALDLWSTNPERPLARLDPRPELIPLRPFFFNVASVELDYPNLEARKQPPKKGGFFGFWR